ncbi:MAG TPA: hypothetical protein VF669_10955 [Tepidisphaeraceae bacterium]|jgi:hypothetical protein
MLTGNQKRAVELAELVINGRVQLSEVSDEQWQLLVLAAGVTHQRVPQWTICERVIGNYLSCEGYFDNACDSAPDVIIPAEVPAGSLSVYQAPKV